MSRVQVLGDNKKTKQADALRAACFVAFSAIYPFSDAVECSLSFA
jgi:hypothetical protein